MAFHGYETPMHNEYADTEKGRVGVAGPCAAKVRRDHRDGARPPVLSQIIHEAA
jgi:hypothetical protein